MTSFKQIEANRSNARKSTGPVTEEGKQRSRCNAVRHGLTAETVIGGLEDAEDYREFEAAVIADYDAQSAVERELVLRLASLLWRLRRATMMETGLFEIEASCQIDPPDADQLDVPSRAIVRVLFARAEPINVPAYRRNKNDAGGALHSGTTPVVDLAQRFLRLADLPNFAFDRLSRYETTLWRQVGQILLALDALDRRKPQERRRPSGYPVRTGKHRHANLPTDL
jgi:hypothetical protein